MSGEMLTGQDTPVVANEVQNLQPEQQTTGTTEAQTDGAEGGKESPAPAKTFTQAELDAIVARERARAERKALREVRQQLQQPPTPQAKPESAEPSQEPQKRPPTSEELEAYLSQKRAEEAKATFIEKLEDATERYPDIMTVVADPRLPFTEDVIEFLADSDVGVDVANWLARHPKEFDSIARMSKLKAGKELSRIEADIRAKPKAQPSKAPDPIKPVGSRGSPSSTSTPSDEDDIATWMEKERKRLRGR